MINFLRLIIPKFIYRKLSESVVLRKCLIKMDIVLHQSHIGIYKNAKDLKEDLLKKKVPQDNWQ